MGVSCSRWFLFTSVLTYRWVFYCYCWQRGDPGEREMEYIHFKGELSYSVSPVYWWKRYEPVRLISLRILGVALYPGPGGPCDLVRVIPFLTGGQNPGYLPDGILWMEMQRCCKYCNFLLYINPLRARGVPNAVHGFYLYGGRGPSWFIFVSVASD
uniref:Secreted protein n=1 Tax=Xenopus tropicalis TaxID=8364 RepID=A0A1B8Y9H7_XENTR